MVTKVTRDVMDLSVRAITDGITIEGNCGANFAVNGTPIGLSTPCDAGFVNLSATNITVTGSLDVTGATITGLVTVPVGSVVMFNAAFATIPSNWQLCDGTNGTPDMTNQFVYGTNTEGELLDSGGSADAVVVSHSHTASQAAHRHKVPTGNTSGNDDNIVDEGDNANSTNVYVDYQQPAITVNSAGVSGVNANIPQYIKLAFIQRMS